MKIFLLILAAINLVAFLAFGIDKLKARRHRWRISEASLLWLAALGGALGAWLGMHVWHHKTLHRKFRWGVPLLLILQLALAVLIGGAMYLLSYSLDPSGREERDSQTMQRLRQGYPEAAAWVDSMEVCGALRDTFIVNSKGVRLHARYASNEEARGTVVLVHGYTDNATSMLMFAPLYHDSLRFNIIAIEHERHGQSEGEAIQMGWLDRLNLELWIGVAERMWPDTPMYLHGVSMGAATVMMCAGDPLPLSVKGVIEDCGYTSVWDEFSGEIHNQFHLPVHPLMDIASALCRVRYGWDFREASALEQVRKSTLPMLFIHGTADSFVPTEMVHRLYAAKDVGPKDLWLSDGCTHAQTYHDYPEEYLRRVQQFLDMCDQSQTSAP